MIQNYIIMHACRVSITIGIYAWISWIDPSNNEWSCIETRFHTCTRAYECRRRVILNIKARKIKPLISTITSRPSVLNDVDS